MSEQQQPSAPALSPPAVSNLAELVGWNAVVRPQQTGLVRPGPDRRTVSWLELDQEVSAVASGLAAHGLVAGQRVALLGSNSIELVVAYLSALRAGFVAVPVNPESTYEELRRVVTDSGARLLLATTPVELPGVPVLPLSTDGLASLAAEGSGPVSSPADAEALAVLLYTAGTSGEPKAVMLTHRALLSHLEHFHSCGVVDDDTVALSILPLFHVFGLNAVLGACLRGGATCVVADGSSDLLQTVVDEGVNNLPVAPSLLYRLLQHDGLREQLARVRTVVSGAAPMSPELAATFAERTGLRVEQGYGLTEASPGVTFTLGSRLSGPGHVGRPLPGVDVRIGAGHDDAEPAEIWVRGDNLFSGYWPDGAGGPDDDGWFATGDVGYLEQGELFLVDRARELLEVRGFTVYPAELENIIRGLTGVQDVAVIGQPDEGQGVRVVAFVVGDGVTADQVLDHCSDQLARFKRPSEVHLLPELPRGATGKVKKGALRQQMRAAADQAAETGAG